MKSSLSMSLRFPLVSSLLMALFAQLSQECFAQRINGKHFGQQIVTSWFADTIQIPQLFMPIEEYLLWMDIQPGSETLREQSKKAILNSHDSLFEAFVIQMEMLKESYYEELLQEEKTRNLQVDFELVKGVRHLYFFTINFDLKIKKKWIPVVWNFETVWFNNRFFFVSPIEESF